MKGYLEALGILKEYRKTPLWQIRAKRQAVAYLMEDAIGIGFEPFLVIQTKLVSESGGVHPYLSVKVIQLQGRIELH